MNQTALGRLSRRERRTAFAAFQSTIARIELQSAKRDLGAVAGPAALLQHLEGLLGKVFRGRSKHRVDYRHIIDWLVRKPGAFASYRYREHLFPTSHFRKAYDWLKEAAPRRCDHRYLEILELAAKEGEARVEDALRLLLQTEAGKQTIVNKEAFQEFLERCEQAPGITDVHISDVSLSSFDQLFSQPGALQ